MLELWPREDSLRGTPFSTESFEYSSRGVEGLDHPVIVRSPRRSGGHPETAIDLNLFVPRGGEALSLRISPDDRKIALSFRAGGGKRELIVYGVEDGSIARPSARDIEDVEWSCGSSSLVVTSGSRGELVHLIDEAGKERSIFEERDPSRFVRLSVSRSGRYLFVLSDGPTASDTLAIERCGMPAARRLQPKREGVRYSVDHFGDRFYVVTNEGAANGRLLAGRDFQSLSEILPERRDAVLERVDLFDGFFAAGWRTRGVMKVAFHDLRSGRIVTPDLPEEIYSLEPLPSPPDGPYRAAYSSYARAPSLLESSYPSLAASLEGTSDPGLELAWIFARSADGARIPISIVSSRDAAPGGPLLLVGYGAYGDDPEMGYSSARRLLLERGFRLAFAHTRGGGFYGARWHEAARVMTKRRAVEDFISAAEALIRERFASPGRLYAAGRSAGALLVASSVMERPDLFGAALLDAPFLDVVGGLSDSTSLLHARETAEWGDPSSSEHRAYQSTYSPMDRPLPESFPPAFVNASVDDEIVRFEEALRWVERIRRARLAGTVALMITSGSGHSGPPDKHSAADAEAVKAAFLLAVDGEAEN